MTAQTSMTPAARAQVDRLRGCTCHIVPADVLRRFSTDDALTVEQRKSFADTSKLDAELRKLRSQAGRVSNIANLIAPSNLQAVASAPAITVYDCHHAQTLPGRLVRKPATAADLTAKRVFVETSSVATFYSEVFGRNSIDGAGMTVQSSIHYGSGYNNAFWNGTQMTYGDGDGAIFVDFSQGNDVIAHELTHGVTQYSLRLVYANEAGGLNESLSDCFGSMFRQWDAKQSVDKADWLIGASIMGPAAKAKGFTCLRDMANPAAPHCLSPQPTQYAQIMPGMDPHESSGPPNLAFCTTAKAMGGNSWDEVGQVWYKAMTGYGPSPNMKMQAFAKRTRTAAAELYPRDQKLAAAVDAGWKSIGL